MHSLKKEKRVEVLKLRTHLTHAFVCGTIFYRSRQIAAITFTIPFTFYY